MPTTFRHRLLALALGASLLPAAGLFARAALQPGTKADTKAPPAEKAAPHTPPPAPSADGGKAAWDAAAKVGPMHEWMKAFEGTWQTEIKSTWDGKTWTSDKGETTNKLVGGGRTLLTEYSGKMMGKFASGHGMMGYNNLDKRFEQVWTDSQSTAMSWMTGTADASGKVLTLTGEMTDAETGKKAKMRSVTTIVSKDEYKMEFFWQTPGQPEMKGMEIIYTKGGAEPSKDAKDAKDAKPAGSDSKKK